MKRIHSIAASVLLIGSASFAIVGCATNNREHSAQARAYPLNKCAVTDEALGKTPYTFVHNCQEVKLCCKDCLADFNKDPEKYMAKIQAAR